MTIGHKDRYPMIPEDLLPDYERILQAVATRIYNDVLRLHALLREGDKHSFGDLDYTIEVIGDEKAALRQSGRRPGICLRIRNISASWIAFINIVRWGNHETRLYLYEWDTDDDKVLPTLKDFGWREHSDMGLLLDLLRWVDMSEFSNDMWYAFQHRLDLRHPLCHHLELAIEELTNEPE